ncbi:ClpXP protease specificity-enhancing factor [Janthinobacterium psychrotolerans]|nr:ClpXP protease specificity-enhancing factor [Janthinobacterium psychrotolerans]
MSEISTKPYMLRAIYEWCTDSGYTPYLAVKVDSRTTVPMEYVKKGEIVLNISFGATSGLKMDNDAVRFHARFGGISREIYVPVDNVMAIYANENGQGMAFEPVLGNDDPHGQPTDSPASADAPPPPAPAATGPTLSSVPTGTTEQRESPPSGDDEPPKKGGRPTLTRIK